MELSTLETVCLRWASQGKSPLATAKIEGVGAEYVQARLDRAVTALKASSVAEAIEKAKDLKTI